MIADPSFGPPPQISKLKKVAVTKRGLYYELMTITSHLKSLQALELTIRTGSFKRTGELLGLTAAAVGQRVKTLEDFLGVDLVVRSRSGIRAAPELMAALPHLERAFAELGAAARELDVQRGQELHIAGPTDFIELWLRPRLSRFRQAHKNILFCINGEGDATMRLARVDCRIEFEAPEHSAETEHLFSEFIVPVCSPAIRDRTARLPAQTRLEGFPLLHLDAYRDDPANPSWPTWLASNEIARFAPERGIRFRRIVPALDAVLADSGICLCGIALLEEQIETAKIALPYSMRNGVCTSHAFVAHFAGAFSSRPHVQRFRNWLAVEAADTASWLSRTTLK